MKEESKERRARGVENISRSCTGCVYPALSGSGLQPSLYTGICCTLEWSSHCSEDPARVSHSQGEHHFCWDRLHRAEVTRTEMSELAPSSRSLCCRLYRSLPPAEAEPRLGSWAAGREKTQRTGGVLIPGNVQETFRCGAQGCGLVVELAVLG